MRKFSYQGDEHDDHYLRMQRPRGSSYSPLTKTDNALSTTELAVADKLAMHVSILEQ